MCGIAGVLMRDGSPVDPRLLERMTDALRHRGPDGQGQWSAGPIGLAHTRLAILDPSPRGHQPLSDAAGEVWVSYNGELYNYPALKAEVEAEGVALRTGTDTELLPYLWRKHGPRLVERLRGMFAFALWDAREQRLFLARDRFGQKPLYYALLPDRVLFGSELKALLCDPALPRTIDPAARLAFLALRAVPGAASIYQAARKLPPAHTLSLSAAGESAGPRRYWQLRFEPDRRPSPDEWAERLEAKLSETVAAHLLSDVPVGAFLSGGIDSSLVTGLMARAGGRLRTFAVGFAEQEFSELPYARAVAEHLGAEHSELVLRPDKVGLIQRLAEVYDEPFADPSALPTLLVSELARRHVRVCLTGDGGDELFGGYPRYRGALTSAQRAARLPALARRGLLALAKRWPRRARGAGTLARHARLDGNYPVSYLSLFRPRELARLLPGALGAAPFAPLEEELARAARAGAPLGQRFQLADVHGYLPDDILVKVDRASMAAGLEARPPLLDHELAELAARLPPELLFERRRGKVLLQRLAARLVPREAIERPKMGFSLPLAAWLRGELRELLADHLLARECRIAPLFRPGVLAELVAEHDSGRDRADQLWALLVLEHFYRRWEPSEP